MFLREALLRCSQLQRETAAHFDALCEESKVEGDPRIASWKGAAARERRRADFLEALAVLCSALEDEGPFLVQIPLQLDELRRSLDSVGWRRDACAGPPKCACAELIEGIAGQRLYADLIELAEPEVRRALRLIGNEIRLVRRPGDVVSARRIASAFAGVS